MKKLLFLLLLLSQLAQGQENVMLGKNNEIRVNLLSMIASGKWNVSYERFLKNDFSVGVTGSYSNSAKISDDYQAGFRNNFPKYEVIPYVRYALSKTPTNYYFAEVFAAANGGDSREIVRDADGATGYYAIHESTYTDIALGAGLGYKLYFKEKFGVELLVGFGTNLLEREKSPDVISRVGLSVGYRF